MSISLLIGDVRQRLKELPDESVHCVVTSPPYYGLRDYGVAGQIGLESSPEAYVAEMVAVFREVRRVLRGDGTLWLNLGDSYAGGRSGPQGANGEMATRTVSQHRLSRERNETQMGGAKQLLGIPWRVAFALQADGFYLRQDIIWSKPNPMPESVKDRCTKAHEYIFLFSKSARYHYDADAISEPCIYSPGCGWNDAGHEIASKTAGTKNQAFRAIKETRNRRSVWSIATRPYAEAHFATFPPELPELCIKAGCPSGGTVLDPFGGAGTTGLVADRLGRNAVLIELNPAYAKLIDYRIRGDAGMFAEMTSP